MHSVYISNNTTHIIFTTVFSRNQCSDISAFENYRSTDIYKNHTSAECCVTHGDHKNTKTS